MTGDTGQILPQPARFRKLLLLLLLVTIGGLTADLLLLEHIEAGWQQVPLYGLALALIALILVVARPTRAALRFFRAVMGSFLVVGAVGVYLHVNANAELERDMDPGARGLPLLWIALRGGVPAGAPAAMAQLGLLGLIFAHRHPESRGRSGRAPR